MLRCTHASYRRRNVFEAAIHTKPGASGTHEPPSGGPHIGGAPATPIAALSGSTRKAPGSAGGYLLLLAPATEAAALAPGKLTTEEAPRTIRADLAEADAILDSVVETHALMNGLRTAAQGVQQLTRLADLLVSQPALFAPHAQDRSMRSSRRFVVAEELRRKIGGLERNLGSLVDQMDRELRQLREAAERLRLVPAGNLFTTLERVARDTARALSKQVAFKGTGGDIRLDARVLDTVQGALVQLIRNAVAHGIESSDERTKTRKPSVGVVSLAISRRDRRIVFSCSDD